MCRCEEVNYVRRRLVDWTYGASVGVSGFDGGSGMPIKVGVFILGGWMCRPVVGLVAFDMKLKVGGLMQELLT